MRDDSFYIVDVFAEEKYQGNQLAVVISKPELISDEEMLSIAKEMNYSETTFVLSEGRENNSFDVRIFTPEQEIPFAGHPTLGTAYIIQQKILGERVEQINLNLKVGQIPVTFSYSDSGPDQLWMKQNNPMFGREFERNEISGILGIKSEDIEERFPIQEVSTGLPFILVPLVSLDAVKRCHVNRDRYFTLVEAIDAKAILVFVPKTYKPENDLNVRVFVDYFGIPEDPATGSGNGCLAGYLVKHRYFDRDEVDIKVEQGYEIGRPSLLSLRAKADGEVIDVNVGGRVVMIAEGKLA